MQRIKRPMAAAFAVGVAAVLGVAPAAGSGPAAPGRPQARASTEAPSTTVWLCRPGLADNPCTEDRSATLVAADGTSRTQRPVTAKSRPVDCFYVYPTVSLQPTVNANFDIDPNQTSVAIAQASRFL